MNSGVGKTSLVARLTNPDRPMNHDISATMGIEFDTQMLDTENGKVKAQIWDTAGQERYRSLSDIYTRDSNIILIVYDITRPNTIDVAIEYITKAETTLKIGRYEITATVNY